MTATRTTTGAAKEKAKKTSTKAKQAEKQDNGNDEDESSDWESALFKMMRMQFGIVAGGAKGMTEMAKMMETFVDSFGDETEIKTKEDWRELIESAPEAMVTATRKAMNKGDDAAQAVMDAYRSYSEAKD